MSVSTADIKAKLIEELQTLNTVLAELFDKDVDIHTHTRIIGQHYRKFYQAEQTYHLSSNNQTVDTVIQEILEKCPDSQKANVNRVLNTIKATAAPDAETGVNLPELLIRTWSFVKKSHIYTNCVELIINNLDHNIITGGGCFPGIAARLIQPYTSFVLYMLTLSHTQNHQFAPKDDDLDKAIALSLATPIKQQYSRSESKDREEQEFQLALYRSKIEQQKRQNPTYSQGSTTTDDDFDMQLAMALSKSTIDK